MEDTDRAGDDAPSRSLGARLGRALPRLVALALSYAMTRPGRSELVAQAGLFLLVGTLVTWRLRRWWRYVLDGVSPSPTSGVAEEFLEPGPFRVVLEAPGDRKIYVVKAVREVTGMGLLPAKRLVEEAPGVVRSGVSRASGQRMQELFTEAGASVRVEDDPDPVT